MRYTYPDIQGKIIDIDDLKFARAKSIAIAIINNPTFFLNPIFIKGNEKEIIVVTLDIESPFRNSNGIEEQEDVAIICHEDDSSFPAVYALREDFPLGLPHTNLGKTEHPVSLCISEQDFSEIKIGFNSYSFIESIRMWLCLTAQNKLHREDQPLEPFMRVKGWVILDPLKNPDKSYLKQLDPESHLYQLSHDQIGSSLLCACFKFDTQVHGFVHKEPRLIADLSGMLIYKTKGLSSLLAQFFNNIPNEILQDESSYNKQLGIFCIVPIKRKVKDKDPEKEEYFFLLPRKSFKEIGTQCLVWRDNLDGTLSKKTEMKFEDAHFEDLEIEIYGMMNEFNAETASRYNGLEPNNNNYVVIGVGALGSQILEIFARMGFGKWTIVDHDRLYPHNLARHILGQNNIGEYKADSVVDKLNSLLLSDRFRPLNMNFIGNGNAPEIIAALTESKAILDISTSIAVARSLARDYTKQVNAKRISIFINPIGTDLVILAEDASRRHKLDFLEMEYYRYLFHTKELHTHLKPKENKDNKIRYNTNSCRDITTIMNQADVSLLASVAAKNLQLILKDNKAQVGIWKTSFDGCINKYGFKPTNWIKKNNSNSRWTLYINNELINQIQETRRLKLPNETGGVLLGCIDETRNVIYLFDTILAPKDSKEDPVFFERGKEGVLDEFVKYQEITGEQIKYLGEWHSHPKGCSTQPSKQDLDQCAFLAARLAKEGRPVYVGICGDNGLEMHLIDKYSRLSDGSDRSSFTLEVFV